MTETLDYAAPTPARRGRWLFFSLLAIALWGVFGVVSKAASNYLSGTDLQVISTLGVVPIALLLLASPTLSKHPGSVGKGVAYGVATGLCGSVGNLAVFVALSRGGEASTVYPLTSVYPLVTVFLAMIILRERLNVVQVLGIGLALGALFLFNVSPENPATQPGASWLQRAFAPWMAFALVGLVLYGVAGVTQKLATNNISTELSTVCFALAFIPVAVAVMVLWPVQSWRLPPRVWTFAVLTGVLISTGTLTLFAAYRTGKASVVTALTALYPALTVVISIPLFNEKLDVQKIGAILLSLGAAVALTFERPPAPQPAATSRS
jgi:uncharacterized membrane protein